MTHRFAMGAALAIALTTCSAFAEDKPKPSGLKVGQGTKPFDVLHCNGKTPGVKNCLV
jgi:hypothetical protein